MDGAGALEQQSTCIYPASRTLFRVDGKLILFPNPAGAGPASGDPSQLHPDFTSIPLPPERPAEFIPAADLPPDSGLSAVERGWVDTEEDALERAKHRARRRLLAFEHEVEVMRLYHRGIPAQDIADRLEISPSTVYTCVNRAIKRTVEKAGAKDEREKQLLQSEAIVGRLMERILPDPDPRGEMPPVDIKAVDAWAKVSRRRAELTGADAPAKLQVSGQIDHTIAVGVVSDVKQYMDLVDTIAREGYGLKVDNETEQPSQVIDAVAIPTEERTLADRVAKAPRALMPAFDSRGDDDD